MLAIQDVTFGYRYKRTDNLIFDKYNMSFQRGYIYSITGRSGSGKSTLLSLIGGLKKPDSGKIIYEDKDINRGGIRKYISQDVGFVFQNFNLLDYMTAAQNVRTSVEIANHKHDTDVYGVLGRLGISMQKADRNINTLSGGEQQRVAIACAIAKDAEVLLADEPTGNLDTQTAMDIFEIFKEIAHKNQKYVIIATHAPQIAAFCDKEIVLRARGE